MPECGDLNSRCSMFKQYCSMEFMRLNGVPISELCPYTCGLCKHHPIVSTTPVSDIFKKTSSSLELKFSLIDDNNKKTQEEY